MAKRVTAKDAKAATNGFDGEILKEFIEKIEGHRGEIESSKGQHMNRCRQIRESIEIVFEEAKAKGIPKKILKAHVDLRLLEAKKEAVVEKLDNDEVDTFKACAEALGEFAALPLGEAALKH
jgi:uncharacterized protein (UPF0335 family)